MNIGFHIECKECHSNILQLNILKNLICGMMIVIQKIWFI